MSAWTACHQDLWPGVAVPALLPPISQAKDQPENGHFHEATLPTSFLWACFVSQCQASKKDPKKRAHAAGTFSELLHTICLTGQVDLQVQQDNCTHVVRVPASGTVPATLMLAQLSDKQLRSMQQRWVDDSQDMSSCCLQLKLAID